MYIKPNLAITENITAVHLGFSNFMYGSLSENLTAVHLGFSNRLHDCRACRNGVVPLTGMMNKINLILALSSTGNCPKLHYII